MTEDQPHDDDPRTYGWTGSDGTRWIHPPYGPARPERPNPYLTGRPEPTTPPKGSERVTGL